MKDASPHSGRSSVQTGGLTAQSQAGVGRTRPAARDAGTRHGQYSD